MGVRLTGISRIPVPGLYAGSADPDEAAADCLPAGIVGDYAVLYGK